MLRRDQVLAMGADKGTQHLASFCIVHGGIYTSIKALLVTVKIRIDNGFTTTRSLYDHDRNP
jgi:hypothetical protein